MTETVHWPELDDDLSIAELMAAVDRDSARRTARD